MFGDDRYSVAMNHTDQQEPNVTERYWLCYVDFSNGVTLAETSCRRDVKGDPTVDFFRDSRCRAIFWKSISEIENDSRANATGRDEGGMQLELLVEVIRYW
jgi:hypothetical protein